MSVFYSRGLDFAFLKTDCINQKTLGGEDDWKQRNYCAEKSLGMKSSEILGVYHRAGIFLEILSTGCHIYCLLLSCCREPNLVLNKDGESLAAAKTNWGCPQQKPIRQQ